MFTEVGGEFVGPAFIVDRRGLDLDDDRAVRTGITGDHQRISFRQKRLALLWLTRGSALSCSLRRYCERKATPATLRSSLRVQTRSWFMGGLCSDSSCIAFTAVSSMVIPVAPC